MSESIDTQPEPVSRDFHVPEIARRTDGHWGVFCAACSQAAGDYTYPCQAHPGRFASEFPPIIHVQS